MVTGARKETPLFWPSDTGPKKSRSQCPHEDNVNWFKRGPSDRHKRQMFPVHLCLKTNTVHTAKVLTTRLCLYMLPIVYNDYTSDYFSTMNLYSKSYYTAEIIASVPSDGSLVLFVYLSISVCGHPGQYERFLKKNIIKVTDLDHFVFLSLITTLLFQAELYSWRTHQAKTKQNKIIIKKNIKILIFFLICITIRVIFEGSLSFNRVVSLHQKQNKTNRNKRTSALRRLLSSPLTWKQIGEIQSGSGGFVAPKSHLQQFLLLAAPFCLEICGSPKSIGMDWIRI